jgi:hypothetical protein
MHSTLHCYDDGELTWPSAFIYRVMALQSNSAMTNLMGPTKSVCYNWVRVLVFVIAIKVHTLIK